MNLAARMWTGHAFQMPCLHCDLSELLEQTRPPDPDLVGLIERAFIAGQIDSQKADLASLWIQAKRVICPA